MVTIYHLCNVPSVKKKKIRLLVPTCSPPNPTTHHTLHSLFSLFGRSLPLLFSFSFSFSVNTTHIHTLLSLTLPPVHSSSSPLPFFPAKSLENPQEHHTFTQVNWGKSFNLFWWVLCSYLRLFYPSFNDDFHVI